MMTLSAARNRRTAKICLPRRRLPCGLNFLTFFYYLSGANFAGGFRSPSPTSSSFVHRDRSVEGLSKRLVPTTRLAATCFMMSPGMRGKERFHEP